MSSRKRAAAVDYEEDVSDDDWKKPVKKRGRPPKMQKRGRGRPAKAKQTKASPVSSTTPSPKKSSPASARRTPRSVQTQLYYNDDDEEDDYDEDEEEEDDDEEENYASGKRGSSKKRPAFASSKSQAPKGRQRFKKEKVIKLSITKPKLPPVRDMVVDSIHALKEDPKVGSTLGTIKQTILLNWPVNMKLYDEKIKKFLRNAIATGEVIQVRGKGYSGRFTVPGLRVRKRRRTKKSRLDARFDVDEPEYKAAKTERDEDREKAEKEKEEQREQRRIEAEEKRREKESKPKKALKERKVEWEVEEIRGFKELKGHKFYLVKFEGFAKPQWEPEANVKTCESLIEAFHVKEEKRLAELEAKRMQEESDGAYEVAKILDVHFSKKDNKRTFLIRWKGHGPEGDTWEPEENLSCDELILKFLAKLDAAHRVEAKSLRLAPKKVERLAFAHSSSRVGRRNQGFRVTYDGMDD